MRMNIKWENKFFVSGFIPKLLARNGQRYTVLATEGLAEFERQQLRNKAALNEVKKIVAIQSGQGEPRNLEERLVNYLYVNMWSFLVKKERIIIKSKG